ncbi:MAG TPA: phosphonate ABC transporter, permease protein PhnE [Candidatus Nesterenkonia stercoripullorum]|uniref:Phosphonate ABC transporter, permease protein PhnE n=1 Tax=Candidatus Nesterenkonia stercoripullorum TaxID=2838701 RepID=A0A9D1USA8_9MICC|nr:phosphonate ABC transporter, permease protein PhnE [Candidatus Nesterenkonia stercoripullorum]
MSRAPASNQTSASHQDSAGEAVPARERGDKHSSRRPQRPRPAGASYAGLLLFAAALIAFFSWISTSNLRLDVGVARVQLYPAIGAGLVLAILALGWRLRFQAQVVFGLLAVLGFTWWAGSGVGFTLRPLWEDFNRGWPVIQEFLSPNWGFIFRVWEPWLVTLSMAIMATFIGCSIGLLLAMFASPVSSPNTWTSQAVKAINSVIRSIPDIGYGLLFVAMLGGTAGGAGPVAGVLALIMFNIGIVAKLTGETIDSVDRGPLEAADATGSTLIQRNRIAVLPQILPGYSSYSLYVFELNIRASVVLGIVGAGGIGSTIFVQLSHFNYSNISAIMIALVVVVLIVDYVSLSIRRRLT